MRGGIWAPLIKLTIYTVTITLATALLVLIIVNGRTGETVTYRAVFSDASGVGTNDNVKIAGVAVGKVTGVRVVERGKAEIEFVVDADMKIPATSRVEIKYENLIGDRFLDLQRSSDDVGSLQDGDDVIPESRTEPALNLTVLFGGFRPLFQALQPDTVDQFAEEILQTLQGQGGTIDTLLARTASLTNTIADRDEVIGSLVEGLNDVLGTVSDRDQQLSSLVLQLQRFVTGLSRDRAAIGSAISSIGSLTDSVSGLLVDLRPPLKESIEQLGGLATNLDRDKGKIAQQLEVIPTLLNRVNRTASYGAWFQFYLCDLGGSLTQTGNQRINITAYQNTAGRCSA